jgi:hypothetical protein
VRPDPLSEAAARRHELTRSKALQALRELDRAGAPVTFAGVAQAAGISRSWLYTQPDISSQIRRLRQEANAAGGIPSAQRPTDASLRARLATALDRNKQLAVMSLDPGGKGRARWSNRWKAALNAFDITFGGRLSAGRR